MNQKIKGTQTEKNLKAAFAGESQARNKYVYYTNLARANGNNDIADLFERMSNNELAHALVWFKLIHNIDSVEGALIESATGESFETNKMYPAFAQTAKEEGFDELADMFKKVGHVESNHELTFMQALSTLTNKNKPTPTTVTSAPVTQVAKIHEIEKEKPYRCVFCGYDSPSSEVVCPLCKAIGAFQRIPNR